MAIKRTPKSATVEFPDPDAKPVVITGTMDVVIDVANMGPAPERTEVQGFVTPDVVVFGLVDDDDEEHRRAQEWKMKYSRSQRLAQLRDE